MPQKVASGVDHRGLETDLAHIDVRQPGLAALVAKLAAALPDPAGGLAQFLVPAMRKEDTGRVTSVALAVSLLVWVRAPPGPWPTGGESGSMRRGRWCGAMLLDHLGDAHHAAGEHDAARDAWQQDLAILDQLGLVPAGVGPGYPDATRSTPVTIRQRDTAVRRS